MKTASEISKGRVKAINKGDRYTEAKMSPKVPRKNKPPQRSISPGGPRVKLSVDYEIPKCIPTIQPPVYTSGGAGGNSSTNHDGQ